VQENASKKKDKGKDHLLKKRRRGNDRKVSWFQYVKKTLLSYRGKSGHQIEKYWKLYPHLCLNKNWKYVKELARRHITTPDEVNCLTERFGK
jgi:hypothetical protein